MGAVTIVLCVCGWSVYGVGVITMAAYWCDVGDEGIVTTAVYLRW